MIRCKECYLCIYSVCFLLYAVQLKTEQYVLVFVSTHSSLEGTQTGGFDIRCLVGEPESRGHVHDEAERVPVFNLRHSHPVDVPLGTLLQLLLHRGGENENVKAVSVDLIRVLAQYKTCVHILTHCMNVSHHRPTKCQLHLPFCL